MSLLPAFVALAISLALQPVAIAVLRRHSVLDIPNQRSSHSAPTPRGGGVVVVLAILVGLLLLPASPMLVGVGIAVLCAGLLGLAEDIRGVPIVLRLVMQAICSVPLIIACADSSNFSVMLLVTGVVFTVGGINAVNFMDGVNGITGGFAIAASIALCLVFGYLSENILIGGALVVSAACAGFLPYNAGRARIFLGDSGSYGIGAALVGLSLGAWTLGATPEAAIAPFMVYIADTVVTMLRRVRSREQIHQAHRTHTYQRLTDLDWSHQVVALYVSALTLACGVLGWLGMVNGDLRSVSDAAILTLCGLYLLTPLLVQRVSQGRRILE